MNDSNDVLCALNDVTWCEEVKDFSSSLFQFQYENASECVDEIIEMNMK